MVGRLRAFFVWVTKRVKKIEILSSTSQSQADFSVHQPTPTAIVDATKVSSSCQIGIRDRIVNVPNPGLRRIT